MTIPATSTPRKQPLTRSSTKVKRSPTTAHHLRLQEYKRLHLLSHPSKADQQKVRLRQILCLTEILECVLGFMDRTTLLRVRVVNRQWFKVANFTLEMYHPLRWIFGMHREQSRQARLLERWKMGNVHALALDFCKVEPQNGEDPWEAEHPEWMWLLGGRVPPQADGSYIYADAHLVQAYQDAFGIPLAVSPKIEKVPETTEAEEATPAAESDWPPFWPLARQLEELRIQRMEEFPRQLYGVFQLGLGAQLRIFELTALSIKLDLTLLLESLPRLEELYLGRHLDPSEMEPRSPYYRAMHDFGLNLHSWGGGDSYTIMITHQDSEDSIWHFNEEEELLPSQAASTATFPRLKVLELHRVMIKQPFLFKLLSQLPELRRFFWMHARLSVRNELVLALPKFNPKLTAFGFSTSAWHRATQTEICTQLVKVLPGLVVFESSKMLLETTFFTELQQYHNFGVPPPPPRPLEEGDKSAVAENGAGENGAAEDPAVVPAAEEETANNSENGDVESELLMPPPSSPSSLSQDSIEEGSSATGSSTASSSTSLASSPRLSPAASPTKPERPPRRVIRRHHLNRPIETRPHSLTSLTLTQTEFDLPRLRALQRFLCTGSNHLRHLIVPNATFLLEDIVLSADELTEGKDPDRLLWRMERLETLKIQFNVVEKRPFDYRPEVMAAEARKQGNKAYNSSTRIRRGRGSSISLNPWTTPPSYLTSPSCSCKEPSISVQALSNSTNYRLPFRCHGSGAVFQFLARSCPRLKTLDVCVTPQICMGEQGLKHLGVMSRLERLVIVVEKIDRFKRKDLEWIGRARDNHDPSHRHGGFHEGDGTLPSELTAKTPTSSSTTTLSSPTEIESCCRVWPKMLVNSTVPPAVPISWTCSYGSIHSETYSRASKAPVQILARTSFWGAHREIMRVVPELRPGLEFDIDVFESQL